MIQHLPLEIILNISSHLELGDKLNLKLTCHKLDEFITAAVLYEDLDLLKWKYWIKYCTDPGKVGNRIIQRLIDNKFNGSLVKVLRVDVNSLSKPILSQLSDFFPNVTRVIYSNEGTYAILDDYVYPPKFKYRTIPLSRWRNTITKINSDHDWSALINDVFWSKYPRLKELDLESLDFVMMEWIREQSAPFFHNAPYLTRLTFREIEIDLDILESIHASFPLLQSLQLRYPAIMDEDDSVLSRSIVPASSVLYLECDEIDGLYTENGVFMSYILKKYTNVQQLVFGSTFRQDYYVKSHDDFKGSSESEQQIEEEISRSKAKFLLYSALDSKFYSNLPKSIKKLTLHISNIDNAIAALARSDMKITMLDLLDDQRDRKKEWKSTNVLEHFQKLSALKTLRIAFNSSVQTFTQPFISSSVTRLALNLYGDDFYVDWILSMFPLLEELYLNWSETSGQSCKIRGRDDNSTSDRDITKIRCIKEYSNLRMLTIKDQPIHSSFFRYIDSTVPNLGELNLEIGDRCFSSSKTTTLKLDLSSCHLNKCNLSFSKDSYSKFIYYCIITIKDISKHVLIDNQNKALLPVTQLRKLTDEIKWIEIISDDVKHLKICDFPVIKTEDTIIIGL